MIHPGDMSWFPSMLIAMGVLFQLVAVCAFLRERSPSCDAPYLGETGTNVREQNIKSRAADKPAPAKSARMRNENSGETIYAKTAIGVGNPTRTAKVKF